MNLIATALHTGLLLERLIWTWLLFFAIEAPIHAHCTFTFRVNPYAEILAKVPIEITYKPKRIEDLVFRQPSWA